MLKVGGGGFAEFDAEFKFAKIQNSYVEGGWVGGGSRNLMLSSNLLKSKIQNSYVEGGLGGFVEFDAGFKFAKIQNSYVEGGWVGGGSQNLMLSSNLLKSKIPMLKVGGGFAEFDAEFKFAKIHNSYFHEAPPTPQKWKFQFRTGLRK